MFQKLGHLSLSNSNLKRSQHNQSMAAFGSFVYFAQNSQIFLICGFRIIKKKCCPEFFSTGLCLVSEKKHMEISSFFLGGVLWISFDVFVSRLTKDIQKTPPRKKLRICMHFFSKSKCKPAKKNTVFLTI